MFCPKCGVKNPDDGKFCRSCGVDLGNVSAAMSGTLAPLVGSQGLDAGTERLTYRANLAAAAIRQRFTAIR